MSSKELKDMSSSELVEFLTSKEIPAQHAAAFEGEYVTSLLA